MAKWPYNKPNWIKLRNKQLYEYPLCTYCFKLGIRKIANVVDHIIPVRDAEHLAFDQGNLQSLCKQCHDVYKQRVEHSGKEHGHTSDGMPVDPKHHWNNS